MITRADLEAEFWQAEEKYLRGQRKRAWAWTAGVAVLTVSLFLVTKRPTELWQWLARSFAPVVMLSCAIKTEAHWRRVVKRVRGKGV